MNADKDKILFITVGTTYFDQLIETVTSVPFLEIAVEKGFTQLLLQIGRGNAMPKMKKYKNIQINYYKFNLNYKEDIQKAHLIISHAGAGSIMDTLAARKNLIVVVNTDLMNNHQTELANALSAKKYLLQTTCKDLVNTFQEADFSKLVSYPKSDTTAFPKLVDSEFDFTTDLKYD